MTERPHIRVNSIGDMAETIPYLLGFEPHDAIVAVIIDEGRIAVTAHAKLTDVLPTGEAEHLMRQISAKYPSSDVVLAAYSSNESAGWDLIGRLAEQIPDGGVLQSFVVDADTWTDSYGDSGLIDRYGAISATATSAGLARLPSRDILAARFRCPPSTPDLRAAVDAARHRVAAMGAVEQVEQMAVLQWLHTSGPPVQRGPSHLGAGDAIDLAVLAQQSPDARDAALISMTRENAAQHRRLWHAVIAYVPVEAATAARGLAGMAAWMDGDGASANVAIEQIEADGAPTGLSRMLNQLGVNMVPPTRWDQLRPAMISALKPEVVAAAGLTSPSPDQHTPNVFDRTPRNGPQPFQGHERDDDKGLEL